MMAQPSVSVIIPTYNRAGMLGETIENLFQQTYRNLEIIVVDDGSTDETQSRLASYGSRIRWTAQKNAGPAAARNRGIAMANGEIVAFRIRTMRGTRQRSNARFHCCSGQDRL